MKDMLGEPISIGATIAYPASVGRSSVLVLARVVEQTKNGNLRVQPLKRKWGNVSDKTVTLQHWDRSIVLPWRCLDHEDCRKHPELGASCIGEPESDS